MGVEKKRGSVMVAISRAVRLGECPLCRGSTVVSFTSIKSVVIFMVF